MAVDPKIMKKIDRAKLILLTEKNSVFYSVLLAQLRLQITEDIPTAATDGISLLINPKFIENMPMNEMVFLLLHEVSHVAYFHMSRMKEGDLDLKVWNAAADYLINLELTKLGYAMPKGGLLDRKYKGMGTMEIYEKLMENGGQNTIPQFDLDLLEGDPGKGDDGQGQKMSDTEKQERIIGNVMKAATQAKMANEAGSIPGHVARLLEDITNPKLPWNVILQQHMSIYAKTNYTWRRPNKRFPDIYLPTLNEQKLADIFVAVDTSGSLEEEELNEFMSEIRYIWDMLKPAKIKLVSFDTEIRDVLEFHEGEYMESLTLSGGGGTNPQEIMDMIAAESPVVSIVMTDGEFNMPKFEGVGTDLIWVKTGKRSFTPPVGRVIDYK